MYKYFKYVRMTLAGLMLLGLTALLLDCTGVLRHYVGWIPKMQLLPAVLALNVAVVVVVLLVTALIGRLYCSLVCPMGIFQDLLIWVHKIWPSRRRFRYRKPLPWLRYTVLALFVILMVAGVNSVALFLAPYSSYARMVQGFVTPGMLRVVAVGTFVLMFGFAFFGRLWCNTFCPVGTLLGLVGQYRLFGIRIDASKCVGCHQCEKGCKCGCIDIDGGCKVDDSRCVDCWNCLSKCKFDAIGIGTRNPRTNQTAPNTPINQNTPNNQKEQVDPSRRAFVATGLAVGAATALHAQEQKMDGGLAALLDKAVPKRQVPLKPFGARSLKNFETRCTACQLCVSQCPEKVLRPSTELSSFMQPYMAYDQGYCRMACTRCSEVCPAGAIQPIAKEQKTAISIGLAVTLHENCISAQGVNCGACARHCPAAAISMVSGPDGRPLPVVNESRCTGCGACEYYCPARPMTAIYVEGRLQHAEI
ncbi:MAG: 4Fe-4S binding protein [Bacteroidales bacterium]|nr:4Fe-4S binding protein [Bacteroidales bacterium]